MVIKPFYVIKPFFRPLSCPLESAARGGGITRPPQPLATPLCRMQRHMVWWIWWRYVHLNLTKLHGVTSWKSVMSADINKNVLHQWQQRQQNNNNPVIVLRPNCDPGERKNGRKYGFPSQVRGWREIRSQASQESYNGPKTMARCNACAVMNMNVEAGRPRLKHAGATTNVAALLRSVIDSYHNQVFLRGHLAVTTWWTPWPCVLIPITGQNSSLKVHAATNFSANSLMLTHLALQPCAA